MDNFTRKVNYLNFKNYRSKLWLLTLATFAIFSMDRVEATTPPRKYKFSNFMKWKEVPHILNADLGLINEVSSKESQVITVTTFPIKLEKGKEVFFFKKNLEKMAKIRGRSNFKIEGIEPLGSRKSKGYFATITYQRSGVSRREAFALIPNRKEIYVLHFGAKLSNYQSSEKIFRKWVDTFEIF